MDLPKSLNIITGTGMSHRRPDGINVILLASLEKQITLNLGFGKLSQQLKVYQRAILNLES